MFKFLNILLKRKYVYFICIKFQAIDKDDLIRNGTYEEVFSLNKRITNHTEFTKIKNTIKIKFLELNEFKDVKFSIIAFNKV